MATITVGTGATINATTIEGQLFQLLHLINNAERGLEPQKFSVIKTDDYILEADFKIPGKVTFAPETGVFTETAEPYLPTLAFSPGSPPGTIKSGTLSQYFIDVVAYIILWQNTSAKNPNTLKNVTMTYNYNSNEYTGNVILPFGSVLGTNGSVTEQATEWLLT
ncbi:hypothetical protein [Chroococcidiopsis sp.]|uniref:hypothetical protein n=1 Tax=Chroococcidiopsis sp. TaxID=3088168 RepID=UPI003F37E682